jgi:hypothetical protein
MTGITFDNTNVTGWSADLENGGGFIQTVVPLIDIASALKPHIVNVLPDGSSNTYDADNSTNGKRVLLQSVEPDFTSHPGEFWINGFMVDIETGHIIKCPISMEATKPAFKAWLGI